MMWTIFEYLYRDAHNHKAFGQVAFAGSVGRDRWDEALASLDEGTYFIAEQIGLPPIYGKLLRWSSGVPTDADHCWHEYASNFVVEESDLPPAIPLDESVDEFVDRLAAVEHWNIWLSPNATALPG